MSTCTNNRLFAASRARHNRFIPCRSALLSPRKNMNPADGAGANTRLWGGRFATGPSEALMALSRAPQSYFVLYVEDLIGSRAHARELARAGLLNEDEAATILAALDAIEIEVREGREKPIAGDEDVHTFLERLLVERLGALGGKLRAGRSRNDQTANDMRLFLRRKAREIVAGIVEVQRAIVEQATLHVDTIAPGFTHLQPAQPVSFGHHLLAHAQALRRDVSRFMDFHQRFNLSPLGAAALGGSSIAVRPDLSALEMGYDGACENSIDAVASRDHVAEFLFACAMMSVNLSRLAEETCVWASRQFAWVRLDDAYSTGSSIMPQKKNPDIAELTRGMTGTLIGNVAGLLATLKGLPLAYNRDLAEDKRSVLETLNVLELVLPAFAGMVATLKFDAARIRRDAPLGFTLATEIADWAGARRLAVCRRPRSHRQRGEVLRTAGPRLVRTERR
jgi:argininosuccinate lyase